MIPVKALTSLIIEPTNTCNLRCSFCFVTEGMEREGGFMDLELFKKVIDDCPDLEHLCMHNWGEPLLNKQLFDMFDYASAAGVQHIVMNTNGTLLTEAMIERLISSPLTILRFSIDGSPETYQRVRGVELAKIEKNIKRLKEVRDQRGKDLELGVVFTVEEETQEDADAYIAHWEAIVDHVRLQPKLIQSPRKEPCPEPFGKDYGKLVVLWDGRVIPCCVDYNATLTLGNAHNDNVNALWRGSAIEQLRREHETLNFPRVCENCNECETAKTDKRFFWLDSVPTPPAS